MTDSRSGRGKLQEQPEYFVPESRELLKTNQNLKKTNEENYIQLS